MADIELIVKIPEEIHEKIQSGEFWLSCGLNLSDAYDFIKNGIPLPKGHGRLIDESDLMPDSDYEDGMFYAVSIGAINGAPTIIEADKAESEE